MFWGSLAASSNFGQVWCPIPPREARALKNHSVLENLFKVAILLRFFTFHCWLEPFLRLEEFSGCKCKYLMSECLFQRTNVSGQYLAFVTGVTTVATWWIADIAYLFICSIHSSMKCFSYTCSESEWVSGVMEYCASRHSFLTPFIKRKTKES